jgi:hypothetical protein
MTLSANAKALRKAAEAARQPAADQEKARIANDSAARSRKEADAARLRQAAR